MSKDTYTARYVHCTKCGDSGSVLDLIGCSTWLEAARRYAEDGERWDECLRQRFEAQTMPETVLAGTILVLINEIRNLRKG